MSVQKTIKRGQVWFYKPEVCASGHIQRGPRPVIIVSCNKINDVSPVVLAVPCTTQIKKNYPHHVLFIMNGGVSVALTEQLMPVNVSELDNLKWVLEEYIMDKVDAAIKVSLGFEPYPNTAQYRPNPAPVDNYVERVDKKVGSASQVDKFYARYPTLKPPHKSSRNEWTPERIKRFVAEYEDGADRNVLAKKYNISRNTLTRYYYKYRQTINS